MDGIPADLRTVAFHGFRQLRRDLASLSRSDAWRADLLRAEARLLQDVARARPIDAVPILAAAGPSDAGATIAWAHEALALQQLAATEGWPSVERFDEAVLELLREACRTAIAHWEHGSPIGLATAATPPIAAADLPTTVRSEVAAYRAALAGNPIAVDWLDRWLAARHALRQPEGIVAVGDWDAPESDPTGGTLVGPTERSTTFKPSRSHRAFLCWLRPDPASAAAKPDLGWVGFSHATGRPGPSDRIAIPQRDAAMVLALFRIQHETEAGEATELLVLPLCPPATEPAVDASAATIEVATRSLRIVPLSPMQSTLRLHIVAGVQATLSPWYRMEQERPE